jgi:hypothetical protein
VGDPVSLPRLIGGPDAFIIGRSLAFAIKKIIQTSSETKITSHPKAFVTLKIYII